MDTIIIFLNSVKTTIYLIKNSVKTENDCKKIHCQRISCEALKILFNIYCHAKVIDYVS